MKSRLIPQERQGIPKLLSKTHWTFPVETPINNSSNTMLSTAAIIKLNLV